MHEKIGSGHEHNVMESKFPHRVLKTPTIANQLMFWFFNIHPKVIRDEHREVEEQLKNSEIKFPQWRVFILPQFNKKYGPLLLNKGYVTMQERLSEDSSLPQSEIAAILKNERNTYLQHRYEQSPDNFITQKNSLYYIDPTKSLSISSILDRKGILSKKRYRKIRDMIKKDIKSVMGKG